jgi:uncharacterized protein DUF6353
MSLVPAAIAKTVARNSLKVQAKSPGLLFGAGIVGVVGSTVLACRATLKMDHILEEAKDKLDTAHGLEHPDYSEADRKKDISTIYLQTGVKVVRAYGPAIILGGLSIAALTSSHTILSRRNTALMSAYALLEEGFAEYRARVVEKYGEDEDRNLRYGSRTEVVKEGKVTHQIERVGTEHPSIYARFFDPFSPSWSKEPEYNLIFLSCQQNYANDLLHSRGHVFLNEVYDMLGIPRSNAGAVVGWLLGVGDDYIDFGVWSDRDNQVVRDFVNGREGAILLDFNVDGVIYDKIELV